MKMICFSSGMNHSPYEWRWRVFFVLLFMLKSQLFSIESTISGTVTKPDSLNIIFDHLSPNWLTS